MRPENKRLVFPLLALFALGAVIVRQKDDKAAEKPTSPAPVVTAAPNVPLSAHVVADGATENLRASIALKELIQTHPEKEIRVDLHQLLTSGQIYPNYQESLGSGGSAIATVLWVNLPGKGESLVFSFNRSGLLDPKLTTSYKQLVIYHEWTHVKQQRAGTYPKSLTYASATDVMTSESSVRLTFEAEAEAYTAECGLAVRIKTVDEAPFCRTLVDRGEPAFREEMARTFAGLAIYANHRETLLRVARRTL